MDDAELEVEFFGLGRLGDGELLGERVVDLFEGLDLRPALGQPLAELRDHAAFKLLALHEEGAEVDQRLGHESGSLSGTGPYRVSAARESRNVVPPAEAPQYNGDAGAGKAGCRRRVAAAADRRGYRWVHPRLHAMTIPTSIDPGARRWTPKCRSYDRVPLRSDRGRGTSASAAITHHRSTSFAIEQYEAGIDPRRDGGRLIDDRCGHNHRTCTLSSANYLRHRDVRPDKPTCTAEERLSARRPSGEDVTAFHTPRISRRNDALRASGLWIAEASRYAQTVPGERRRTHRFAIIRGSGDDERMPTIDLVCATGGAA